MLIVKIKPELEGVKNLFIKYCYQDVADKDYIAARLCYKNDLFENYLWCALQSIEKYIKAILLFNDMSSKIGHDLKEGMRRVRKIKEIKWDFDAEYKCFVEDYLVPCNNITFV